MHKNTKVVYNTDQAPVDIISFDIMVLKNARIKYPCRLGQFSVCIDNNLLKESSSVIDNIIEAANFNPNNQTFIKFTFSIMNGEPMCYMHVFTIRPNAPINIKSKIEFNKLILAVTDKWDAPTDNEINNLEGYNHKFINTLINQPLFQIKYTKKLKLEALAITDGYIDLTDALSMP